MKLSYLGIGVGMLGIGTMAQQGSTLIDLGEAAKPIEDFGTGAAKAGGAVIKAVANGAELPAWLLAFALVVLLIRVFFTSQATDKVVQGRNERAQQQHAIEMAKLLHTQEMEKLEKQLELRKAADGDR